MKKQLITLAVIALGNVPLQQVVLAEAASIVQPMKQYSLFENTEFGVTVKVSSEHSSAVYQANIEVVKDSRTIQEVLGRLPKTLDQSSFDLLLIRLVDEAGNPVTHVPTEIKLESEQLRGNLEKILFLSPDAEYRTIPFNASQQAITFTTDKTNEFALVYQKSEAQLSQEQAVVQQDKLEQIVGRVEAPTTTPVETLEAVVARAETVAVQEVASLNEVVALVDQETVELVVASTPHESTEVASTETPSDVVIDTTAAVVASTQASPAAIELSKEAATEVATTTSAESASTTEPIAAVASTQDETTETVVVAAETSPEVEPVGVVEAPVETTSVEETVAVATEPVEQVEAATTSTYDVLADNDADGYTNGVEASLGTNPDEADTEVSFQDQTLEEVPFFLDEASATTFATRYAEGKAVTFEVAEKVDEQGRTHFDVTFAAVQPAIEPVVAEEVVTSEVVDSTASVTEATVDEVASVAALEAEVPVDAAEVGSEPQPQDTVEVAEASPTTEVEPTVPLPEEHLQLLENGYVYKGTEGDAHVYEKASTSH
ncbi:MAG: hypothetical protein Q4B80_01810 [Aerococcaceae bacterium]|nr:hypothetical protein [Aerococcaceae bacterium]